MIPLLMEFSPKVQKKDSRCLPAAIRAMVIDMLCATARGERDSGPAVYEIVARGGNCGEPVNLDLFCNLMVVSMGEEEISRRKAESLLNDYLS